MAVWRNISWIPLEDQQFTSEVTTTRIWRNLQEFIFGDLQDNFSGKQKSWSVVKTETTGISLIDSHDSKRGYRQAVLHSRTYQHDNCEGLYVFSAAVLFLGEEWETIPIESWKNQIQVVFRKLASSANWVRLLECSTEFEWKILPGFTDSGYPQRDSE